MKLLFILLGTIIGIVLFLLTLLMLLLVFKFKFKYSFVIYLLSYGIFRFVIEFFRGDERGAFLGIFSPSQVWCIVMILGAIPLYFLFLLDYIFLILMYIYILKYLLYIL